jgi:hypothetical protein
MVLGARRVFLNLWGLLLAQRVIYFVATTQMAAFDGSRPRAM